MSRQKDESIDQSLLRFEKALTQMAKSGQIDLPMDDEFAEIILDELEPVDLTADEYKKLSADIRMAHQDRAIEQARELLPMEKKTFGGYIQFLRHKAKLSVAEIARRLGGDKSYLENIEAGFVSPVEIDVEKVADIMELFRITLTEFVGAVRKSLALAQVKKGNIEAIARSSSQTGSEERTTGVSQALDAALLEIGKRKGQVCERDIHVDEKYLEEIKGKLIQRDRSDLLI